MSIAPAPVLNFLNERRLQLLIFNLSSGKMPSSGAAALVLTTANKGLVGVKFGVYKNVGGAVKG